MDMTVLHPEGFWTSVRKPGIQRKGGSEPAFKSRVALETPPRRQTSETLRDPDDEGMIENSAQEGPPSQKDGG